MNFYEIIAFDHFFLYDAAMDLKRLSIATLVIGLFIFAVAVFVVVVLAKPGWFPFQPTFGDNVVTLSAIVSAGAALILASAAFRSVDENRRIREQEAEFDFKRRQLDSILDWAQDIKREWASKTQYTDYQPLPGLEAVAARNDWVTMIAKTFGDRFYVIVTTAANCLHRYTDAWANDPDKVTEAGEELAKSLHEVLMAVYRIKSELKL